MTLSRKLALYIVKEKVSVQTVVDMLTGYKMLALPAVYEEVKKVSRKEEKDLVEIESPFLLDEKSIDRVKALTIKKDVPYKLSINESLLAGFKARYRGILYDGSAERIIKQLKGKL